MAPLLLCPSYYSRLWWKLSINVTPPERDDVTIFIAEKHSLKDLHGLTPLTHKAILLHR